MNKPVKIHILYEYGIDLQPHGSAYIRLLRPLTHPKLKNDLDVTYGLRYKGEQVDFVILDRLWRPDVSIDRIRRLVANVERARAKLVYAIDDNFFELPPNRSKEFTQEQLEIVNFLIHIADRIIVTTQHLKECYIKYNSNIIVIPQALDERLLIPRKPQNFSDPFNEKRIVIGYMGTLTHDDDLEMVLPALESICKKYPDEIEIQIIGCIGRNSTKQDLSNLPVYYIEPKQGENEYPLFMLWYTSTMNWDIAIAPLIDNRFNRSKSDIKFLDYSAIGVPGVYSKVPAYISSIQHLETGWLAGNQVVSWTNALETLLNDSELREKLARNASRYLFSQRTLAHSAHRWLESLEIQMVS
jgi:glycosyltransferase involved in cell wall biosynthesis